MDKNNLMNKYLLLFIPILFIVSGLKSQNAETSLDFDGANDYVNCGANSAFQVTNLTVEAWINADAWRTNNWQGTILSTDSWSGTGGQRGWVLRTGDNGRLTLLIANGSTGAWMECMSAQIMSTGKWYHVAGTYDGQTQKVYINGTLVQSYTNTGGIRYTTNDNMMIGDCTGQVGNRVFDGKIDEVRLWSAALDSTTLKKWMYKDLDTTHSQYSNLVAYYKLDEGTGTTTNDSSTNSNTGTLTNFGTTPWAASYAPLISIPTNYSHDVAATWPVQSSSSSSIMKVSDAMSGNTYIVYGHNNNPLSYNTSDKPAAIQKRLSRSWRLEKEGTLTGDVVFDYTSLDTSGFYTFKLLVSTDTGFATSTIISGTKIGNKKIRFSGIAFQDSTFYTIGAFDFQGPTVQTKSTTNVLAFSATANGHVVEDGGLSTTRGFCWSTSPAPTIALTTKSNNGTGQGNYQHTITGLSPNTTYYVRAYAYNSMDTAYGGDSSFTTPSALAPTVTTDNLITAYTDSLYVQGTVVSNGNAAILERGFCWGTSQNPTADLSTKKVVQGSTGTYFGMASGLNPGTMYHIRAYAINAIDTAYGGDSVFTTLSISVPTVLTGNLSNVEGYSAELSGAVTFDGRRPVTYKGICYGTSPNPVVGTKDTTFEGTGTGNFQSKLTGLQPNTTYYARAYATNSVGTAYGRDTSFLTATHPDISLNQISNISYYSASCQGQVTFEGRMPVTSRGICYGTSPGPTILNSTVIFKGSGLGIFSANLTGLNQNTTYYVRSFAINAVDTSYSADSTFTTEATTIPVVTTKKVSNITHLEAKSGGEVLSDGGASISARGVCWSTSPNPTANLTTKTIDGSGLGSFNSTITGLQKNTTYHVRAYAINNVGAAYGGDSVFKTPDVPTVITYNVTNIGTNSAQCGGDVTDDGGSLILQKGICWNDSPNPTANLPTKSTNGIGIGSFMATMNFLQSGKTYYVRAYAINVVDTVYGSEKTFQMPKLPV
jgi:hypothetical protein